MIEYSYIIATFIGTSGFDFGAQFLRVHTVHDNFIVYSPQTSYRYEYFSLAEFFAEWTDIITILSQAKISEQLRKFQIETTEYPPSLFHQEEDWD